MRKVGQATSVQISNVKSVIGREAAFNFTLWEVGKEDVVTFAVRKAGGLRYGAVFPDGEPLVSGVRTYDTPKEAIKALNIKDSVIKDSGMKDVVYICEKCHSQVNDSQKYCSGCGSRFDSEEGITEDDLNQMASDIEKALKPVLKPGNTLQVYASTNLNYSVTIRFSGKPINVVLQNDDRYLIALAQTVGYRGKGDKMTFEVVSKSHKTRHIKINKKTGTVDQVTKYIIEKVKNFIIQSEGVE